MGIQGYMRYTGCIDYMANASMAFSHGVYTQTQTHIHRLLAPAILERAVVNHMTP